MIFVYDRNEKQINAIDEIYELTKEIGKLKTLEFDSELDLEKGYRVIINDNEKPLEFVIVDSEYSRGDTNLGTLNYRMGEKVPSIRYD